MRILYIHQYFTFPDSFGGTRSYDLAQRFVRAGHQVTVITANNGKNIPQTKRWEVIQKGGIECHLLRSNYSNKMSYGKRAAEFIKFFVLAFFRALTIRFDFVLATSTPLTVAIPALLIKTLRRKPFVFEVRDVWPEVPVAMGALKNKWLIKGMYWLEKKAYKNATAIVALSTDMQRSMQNRFSHCVSDKLYVIENISETERFEEAAKVPPKLGNDKTLLYAGTFGTANGLAYVVELARILQQHQVNNIRFHLYGDGREKESIRAMADSCGVLNQTVFIYDPVAKNELDDLYKHATWGSSFCLPVKELWANSANKFFDTLAAGRPIIINYEGWQAELIRQENIGYVLPYDLKDFDQNACRQFADYASDDTLIAAQGSRARSIAEKCYSLNVASHKYMEVLKRHGLLYDWVSTDSGSLGGGVVKSCGSGHDQAASFRSSSS